MNFKAFGGVYSLAIETLEKIAQQEAELRLAFAAEFPDEYFELETLLDLTLKHPNLIGMDRHLNLRMMRMVCGAEQAGFLQQQKLELKAIALIWQMRNFLVFEQGTGEEVDCAFAEAVEALLPFAYSNYQEKVVINVYHNLMKVHCLRFYPLLNRLDSKLKQLLQESKIKTKEQCEFCWKVSEILHFAAEEKARRNKTKSDE